MSNSELMVLHTTREILMLPLDRVTSSPQHARIHNRKKRRKLEKLISRFGQVTPIIVDEGHEIIDGHAVVSALNELGQSEVAAIVVANRDPAEIRALRLALNRVVHDAEWDNEKLRSEFRELADLSFDLELTGFEAVEIDMVLELDPPAPGNFEQEHAADLEPGAEPPVLALGDIFRAGRHELGCGDARNAQLLASLVVNRQISVVFTDPPYNVRIDGFVSGKGRTHHREFAMASGEMTQQEFVDFLSDSIAVLLPNLADGAILYLCMDWRHMGELLEAASRNGLELKNLCIWCKTNAGNGSFYRSQHELVFVFKQGNGAHQNHFKLGQHGRLRTNVWTYPGVNTFAKDRMELLGAHPTVKPWQMIADALRDVSRHRDYVLDTFLGSGSTLIAAEKTGRTCVGMDIDPAYVEIAIRRWQKLTGQDAIHTLTGESFDELVARRRAERAAARLETDEHRASRNRLAEDDRGENV